MPARCCRACRAMIRGCLADPRSAFARHAACRYPVPPRCGALQAQDPAPCRCAMISGATLLFSRSAYERPSRLSARAAPRSHAAAMRAIDAALIFDSAPARERGNAPLHIRRIFCVWRGVSAEDMLLQLAAHEARCCCSTAPDSRSRGRRHAGRPTAGVRRP